MIYFLILTALIFLSYFFVDKSVAEYFLANIPSYEHIGDTISILGESHWYIGTAIIGFIFFKYFKKNKLFEQRFLFLLYINIFSGLISLVLKQLFGRIRPWGMRGDSDDYGFLLFQNFDLGLVEKMKYHFITVLESPTTYSSFPSGHTTTVAAVFTYLIILFPRHLYLIVITGLIIVSSRILANDHFVSDIFAGIIVGSFSTIYLYSKFKEKINENI
ncbi:phosphatase PAP2 family protein [Sulfurimonas sp.]|uniref:phosphatase PAP2 family protein n=1 Tax=Sulfurimonas sp. TaxID=2022749 RepID=UPI002B477871|nr:phosphatase PAP2 family protein [Sulfurimonas sp.]